MSRTLEDVLHLKNDDKFLLIKEHDLADSNFVITNLLNTILSDPNSRVCFILMHNTLGHYHNVAQKLNYSLLDKIKSGLVKVIEPMTSIFQELADKSRQLEDSYLVRCHIVFALVDAIKNNMSELKKNLPDDGKLFLIIDDLSHLFDVGVTTDYVVQFVSVLTMNSFDDNATVIINMHIGDDNDYKICGAIEYYADVEVDVAPLKTGRSHDVTGILTIERDGKRESHHYKAREREIRILRPGEGLIYR